MINGSPQILHDGSAGKVTLFLLRNLAASFSCHHIQPTDGSWSW